MKDNITRLINAAVEGLAVMDSTTPNYAGIWAGKPAIVTIKAKIAASVGKIEDYEDDVQDDTGNETAKVKAKDKAAKLAYKMAKPMSAYATSIDDDELRAAIDFTWSDTRYGKDSELIDNWQEVHDRAFAIGLPLVADGYIGATDVADLQGLIDDFVAIKPVPKVKIDTKKAIHISIDDEAKTLRATIKSINELLVQYKDSAVVIEKEFYEAVTAAFDEDNTNVRHRAIAVKYVDDATGVELPKVKTKLVELADLDFKLSSEKGNIFYTRQETPQGSYTMQSELVGYQTDVKVNVPVDHKTLRRFEIRLVKVV